MTNEKLKAIISDAIETEVESYEFYRDAANKVKNTSVRDIFEKLSKEELEHRNYLQNFLESKANVIQLVPTEDYEISESIDETPRLSTNLNFTDALKIAMKKEEEAMKNYEYLASLCVDDAEKKIFLGLRNMEEMHKTRLEEVYTNVAFVEAW